ncbi:hypothetical protein BDF19DRAFT_438870 [Syncephalis fuscata]|nr:hypothetical protein BDF19DRAFT_438870 [Syncephalis fuscata]
MSENTNSQPILSVTPADVVYKDTNGNALINQSLPITKSKRDITRFTDALNRETEADKNEELGKGSGFLTHCAARSADFEQCLARATNELDNKKLSPAPALGPRSLSANTTPELKPATLLSIVNSNQNQNITILADNKDNVAAINTTNDKNQRDANRRSLPSIRTWRSSPFLNVLATLTGRRPKQILGSSPSTPTSPLGALFPGSTSLSMTNTESTVTSTTTHVTEDSDVTTRAGHGSNVGQPLSATRKETMISEDEEVSNSDESALSRIPLWPPISSTMANTDGAVSSSERPTRIVIVGGSYAGLTAAKELDLLAEQYNLHITVIEPRDHLFYNVAFLRSAVIDISRLCFLSADRMFTSGRVHHCRTRVRHLERRHVVLEQWSEERIAQHKKEKPTKPPNTGALGQPLEPPPAVIPYDYAIIAAGSNYPGPMKLGVDTVEEGIRDLAQVRASIQRSKRILVVGGGPSGVELVTEIKHYNPEKEVTLVHKTDQLVNGLSTSRKLHRHVERSLQRMGVNIRLNETLLLTEPQRLRGFIEETSVYTTNLGESIETDLLFVCAGNVRYNTKLVEKLAANTLEEVINSQGEIHVLPTLQLVPYPHIFAVGDCSDAYHVKLAVAAIDQARVCARNIIRLIQHRRTYEAEQQATSAITEQQPEKQMLSEMESYEHIDSTANLIRYQPTFKFVLSLGPDDGIGIWIARRFKSRTLMLPFIYRLYNLTFPSKARTF